MRLAKLELAESKRRVARTSRLSQFQQMVQLALDEAQDINKQASMMGVIQHYRKIVQNTAGSTSPIVNPLQRKETIRSKTTQALHLAATPSSPLELEVASPGNKEIKYDPSGDLERSTSIVRGLQDFLLTFDDYSYQQINEKVGETLRSYRTKYMNRLEHHADFDIKRLDKISYQLVESTEQQSILAQTVEEEKKIRQTIKGKKKRDILLPLPDSSEEEEDLGDIGRVKVVQLDIDQLMKH